MRPIRFELKYKQSEDADLTCHWNLLLSTRRKLNGIGKEVSFHPLKFAHLTMPLRIEVDRHLKDPANNKRLL